MDVTRRPERPGTLPTSDIQKRYCKPCKRRHVISRATLYCHPCMEMLCTVCSPGHRIFNGGEHKIAMIESFSALSKDSSLSKLTHCASHEKPLRFLCTDHGHTCCLTCIYDAHKDCRYQPIKDVTEETLKALAKEFEEIVNKIISLSLLHDTFLKDSVQKITDLLAQIEEIKSYVVCLLQETRRLSENQQVEKSILAKTKLDISWSKSIVNDAILTGNRKVNFILGHMLREKVNAYVDLVKETHENNHALKGVIDSCEECKAVIQCRTIFVHDIYDFFRKRKHTRKDIVWTQADGDSKKDNHQQLNLKLIETKSIRVSDCRNGNITIVDMAYLHDGRLVLIDGLNNRCIIYSNSLETSGKPYTFQTKPRGVATMSDSAIAVTVCDDKVKKVCILDVSDERRIRLKHTFITSVYCDSICQFGSGSFAITSFNDDTGIILVNTSGHESKIRDLALKRRFFDFGDCKCDFDDKGHSLYVSDKEEKCVYVYNSMERKTMTLRNERLMEPSDIVVGREGQVLVSCTKNRCVLCFDSIGQLKWEHKLQTSQPKLLTITADRSRLCVLDEENCVHIYQVKQ